MNKHVSQSSQKYLLSTLENSFSRHKISFSRIDDLQRLTGGSSHDTWAFNLYEELTTDGPQAFVVRRGYGDAVLGMPLDQEFELMQWLYNSGQQVPRQYFYDQEDDGFGTTFSVCERVSGTDLRKALAKSDHSVDKQAVGGRLVSILAGLHKLDLVNAPLPIGTPSDSETIEKEIHLWTQKAFEPINKKTFPLIYAAIHWLSNNIPNIPQLSLVHGDFKNNNVLYGDTSELIVLDWELSHVGDPLEDLAWAMLWRSKYDLVGGIYSCEEFVSAYESAAKTTVDYDRLFYWQLFALVKLAVVLLTGSGTLTSTKDPSMTHRLLARSVPCLEQGIAAFMKKTI